MNRFPSDIKAVIQAEVEHGAPDLDALLRTLGGAVPEPGLEERVLVRLRAVSGLEGELAAVVRGKKWFPLEGWAPVAMAGSMACILAGGVLIERAAPVVAAPHVNTMAGKFAQMHSGTEVGAGTHAFATAAARVEPGAAVRVGGRRGRASRQAHSAEELRLESNGKALPVRRR